MRILLYELATGGGLAGQPGLAGSPWLAEGRAMLRALAADFAALPAAEISALCDRRLKLKLPGCRMLPVDGQRNDLATLAALAGWADWTIVIAPETGGLLEARARAVLEAGGSLLTPGPELIALCADKQRTAEYLARRGVPIPPGCRVEQGGAVPRDWFPAVLKPCDGAGCQGVRIVDTPGELIGARAIGDWRVERYQPGVPASVSCLRGPVSTIAMQPCRQRIVRLDNSLHYAGGELPLPAGLRARATRLAEQAAAALPPSIGYLGIDMVLGPAPDGSQDMVIEINPRLTTSYVGLRRAARGNLAAAMVALAEGREAEVRFSNERVLFSASGRVRRRLLPDPRQAAR